MISFLQETGYDLPSDTTLYNRIEGHIREQWEANTKSLRSGTIEQALLSGLSGIGVSVEPEHWVQARWKFYSVIDGIVFPRVGLLETLRALHENGYQLGLLSNTYWAGDLHDKHLKDFGILAYLPTRLYSSNHSFVKPHPSIFCHILSMMGADADTAAYIGDRPDVDVAGAQAAGMKGILIRSPYRLEGLPDGQPDAIISELPELIPALERLNHNEPQP